MKTLLLIYFAGFILSFYHAFFKNRTPEVPFDSGEKIWVFLFCLLSWFAYFPMIIGRVCSESSKYSEDEI